MRSSSLHIDASGITRRGRRLRTLSTSAIRRVYVYVDANGDECLVARGPGLTLQFVSRRELVDPEVRRGAEALIHAVEAAKVDERVPVYLASFATH